MNTSIDAPRERSWRRFARAADERGSALVEAALIIPVIIFLTFGAIEFGFAFNEQGTVRSATRAAARAASTQPKASDAIFEAAAIDSLNASANNLVNGEPDFALVYDAQGGTFAPTTVAQCGGDCVYYDWNGSSFTYISGSWPAASRGACPGQSDRVGVFMKVHHEFITGLFSDAGLGLSGRTVMALEPSAGPDCAGS